MFSRKVFVNLIKGKPQENLKFIQIFLNLVVFWLMSYTRGTIIDISWDRLCIYQTNCTIKTNEKCSKVYFIANPSIKNHNFSYWLILELLTVSNWRSFGKQVQFMSCFLNIINSILSWIRLKLFKTFAWSCKNFTFKTS